MVANTKNLKMAVTAGVQILIIVSMFPVFAERKEDFTQQTFLREPKDKMVILGEDILLPCRVQNKVGMLQWTRDGFGLGSDRELIGFPRYTMVGNDEEGDYSLQVINAQLVDDAEFQCQVGAAEGVTGIRSTTAVLTVLVPPEPPIIVQGDYLWTTTGMTVELTCEARGGRPPAELAWVDGKGDVVETNTDYKTHKLTDGKRSNAILTWKFTPKREDHLKSFTCRSENSALKQPALASITVNVKYAPKLDLLAHSTRILENSNVQFTCKVDANPPEVSFKWYRNDEQILGNNRTVFVLNRLTRENNRDAISCEVSNTIGTTKATHTINVQYGPMFTRKLENVEADLGDRVTLSCDVDSNPKSNIIWTSEHSTKVLGTGPVLVIPKVTPETSGVFECRATVSGFPQVSEKVMIFLKGPPITTAKKTQFGKQGDTVEVECMITSVPKPSRVVWTRNSQILDIDNSRGYEIIKQPLENGMRNLLMIHKAQSEDFGLYNCSVWNEYGHDSVLIQLKRQESIPTLIIIAGSIGGIVFVASVTAVTIMCVRKRSPMKIRKFQSRNKGKDSDTSARDYELKVQVRSTSSVSNENDPGWNITNDVSRAREANDLYKFPAEYSDSVFTPVLETPASNGYVPYVDYTKEYTPPSVQQLARLQCSSQYLEEIDPRFHAGYANPYLRNSHSTLPSPHGVYLNNRGQFFSNTFPQKHYITADPNSAQVQTSTVATHV
ncbi:irregular chiasm C-roughest protein-like [Limulus polyphemus]|uniref:Irregular chiasm C-roughest protein-like n=1 Tax=Limulus polyphemus TaxID=6850 RepID=A0ABM1SFE9_LIMPO|nr:irregular chiasm C-roughest protein-like [Limulus polyphemus]